MRYIDIDVKDEQIIGQGVTVGAAGSHNDVKFRIKFNDAWADTGKSAQFLNARHQNPTLVLISPTDYDPKTGRYFLSIPAEAKEYSGTIYMTIKGTVVDEDLVESATLAAEGEFKVLESGWDEDNEEASDITPTQAEQFAKKLEDLADDIESAVSAANRAEVAAAAAEISKEDAYQSEQAAERNREQAEEAAADAVEAWENMENLSVAANTLPANQPASVEKTNTGSGYRFTFGIPRGMNGVALHGDGMFCFNVDGNGHLLVTMEDTADVNFYIDPDTGHLIAEFEV